MSDDETTALAKVNAARAALDEVNSLSDALWVRDIATAAAAFATARGADDTAFLAMEVKLRAERRAGDFLSDLKSKGELRPGPKSSHDASNSLEALRVSKDESSRWQRIAAIPEDKFEEYILTGKDRTQAALLGIAKSITEIPTHSIPWEELRALVAIDRVVKAILGCNLSRLFEGLTPQEAGRVTKRLAEIASEVDAWTLEMKRLIGTILNEEAEGT